LPVAEVVERLKAKGKTLKEGEGVKEKGRRSKEKG
jgi:hypothetical protein